MLKMGQMCHCKATVLKWDSSGNVLWKRFRGLDQSSNNGFDSQLYIDSRGYVFTGGTAVKNKDNGCVEYYDPTDIEWYSNRNSLTETQETSGGIQPFNNVRLLDATDSYIWREGPGRMLRYDTSGVLQQSSAINLNSLFRSTSGAMMGYARGNSAGGLGFLKRYNTSLTVTHTAFTGGGVIVFGGIYDALAIDSTRIAVLGWHTTTDFTPARIVVITDHNLTPSGSLQRPVGDGEAAGRACNTGTTVFAFEDAATPRFRKYDCSGTNPTLSWTNTTMQSTGTGYKPAVNNATPSYNGLLATDGTDFYVVSIKNTSSAFKIQKRSGTDGSITWETDVGTGYPGFSHNFAGLAVGGGVVAVVGLWYNGAGSTDPRSVIALDSSTGSVLFHKAHAVTALGGSITGLYQVYVDSSGNVYASGGAGN